MKLDTFFQPNKNQLRRRQQKRRNQKRKRNSLTQSETNPLAALFDKSSATRSAVGRGMRASQPWFTEPIAQMYDHLKTLALDGIQRLLLGKGPRRRGGRDLKRSGGHRARSPIDDDAGVDDEVVDRKKRKQNRDLRRKKKTEKSNVLRITPTLLRNLFERKDVAVGETQKKSRRRKRECKHFWFSAIQLECVCVETTSIINLF